jgi:hypothetical protein
LLVLAVGCVLTYLLADSLVPRGGTGRARGMAMGLIFWPIAAGIFVIDCVLFVILRKVTGRLFGLKDASGTKFPEVKALRAQGYKYGKAPTPEPERRRSNGES